MVELRRNEQEHGAVREAVVENGLCETELPERLLHGIALESGIRRIDEEAGALGDAIKAACETRDGLVA
jgi:hypothetical protein